MPISTRHVTRAKTNASKVRGTRRRKKNHETRARSVKAARVARRFKEGDSVRLKGMQDVRTVAGLLEDLVILDQEVRHSRVWRHEALMPAPSARLAAAFARR